MSWQERTENFNALHINFKIFPSESQNLLFRPQQITVAISPANQVTQSKSQLPFPYYTDALVGLAAFKILGINQDSIQLSANNALCALLWENLEPMHSVYQRSNTRLKPLLSSKYSPYGSSFEANIKEIFKECCSEKTIDFRNLTDIISAISFLEKK